jgi:hypothetical protein
MSGACRPRRYSAISCREKVSFAGRAGRSKKVNEDSYAVMSGSKTVGTVIGRLAG